MAGRRPCARGDGLASAQHHFARRARQLNSASNLYISVWKYVWQEFAMRRIPALFFAATRHARLHASRRLYSEPIVKIQNGTFYGRHPSSKPASSQEVDSNTLLFPSLTLSLPSFSTPNQHWAILSPSSTIRTAFLEILRGQFICYPPTARTFPFLHLREIEKQDPKLRYPEHAIEYVGFDVQRKQLGCAYLSARYESLKEDTDFTLQR
jgi:hypothetical protein